MNSRIAKSLVPRLSPSGLMVLVIILAFGFVAIVLIPGLELASELADSSVALKFAGQQQRNPALIRASLESMHDRLSNRGYIQESLDQLRDAAAKLDEGLRQMNAPGPASWFALSGDPGARGEPISGKHAAALRDLWAAQQEALQPLLKFTGVPYQDNETTGTVLNENGRLLERDVTAALRVGRRTIPQLDAELGAIVTDLQTGNARSATELRLVMLTGLLIALVLGANQGKSGQNHQSSWRGRGQLRQRPWQDFHPLSAIRIPPGTSRRQNPQRVGGGIRRQRARGSRPGTAIFAKPGAGAG